MAFAALDSAAVDRVLMLALGAAVCSALPPAALHGACIAWPGCSTSRDSLLLCLECAALSVETGESRSDLSGEVDRSTAALRSRRGFIGSWHAPQLCRSGVQGALRPRVGGEPKPPVQDSAFAGGFAVQLPPSERLVPVLSSGEQIFFLSPHKANSQGPAQHAALHKAGVVRV